MLHWPFHNQHESIVQSYTGSTAAHPRTSQAARRTSRAPHSVCWPSPWPSRASASSAYASSARSPSACAADASDPATSVRISTPCRNQSQVYMWRISIYRACCVCLPSCTFRRQFLSETYRVLGARARVELFCRVGVDVLHRLVLRPCNHTRRWRRIKLKDFHQCTRRSLVQSKFLAGAPTYLAQAGDCLHAVEDVGVRLLQLLADGTLVGCHLRLRGLVDVHTLVS